MREALSFEEGFAITEKLLHDLGINEQNFRNCDDSDAQAQAEYLFGEITQGRARCSFCGKTCKHTPNTHRAAAEP